MDSRTKSSTAPQFESFVITPPKSNTTALGAAQSEKAIPNNILKIIQNLADLECTPKKYKDFCILSDFEHDFAHRMPLANGIDSKRRLI